MLVPQIVGVPAESPPVIENWSSVQSPINWPKRRKTSFYNTFVGSEPPKLRGSPNIFLTKYQLKKTKIGATTYPKIPSSDTSHLEAQSRLF